MGRVNGYVYYPISVTWSYLLTYRKADVVISNELARQYADQGIIAIAVNPGMVASIWHILRHMSAHKKLLKVTWRRNCSVM